MIHVYAAQLPEVKVRNNYYKLDSVQNRQEYAKYFNFRKPTLRISSNPNYNPGGLTAGFDLDEIINMFRTRRNRNLAFLQKRLLDEEQNKYIDRRFSKLFVRKNLVTTSRNAMSNTSRKNTTGREGSGDSPGLKSRVHSPWSIDYGPSTFPSRRLILGA
jgi:hypothetical protein